MDFNITPDMVSSSVLKRSESTPSSANQLSSRVSTSHQEKKKKDEFDYKTLYDNKVKERDMIQRKKDSLELQILQYRDDLDKLNTELQ